MKTDRELFVFGDRLHSLQPPQVKRGVAPQQLESQNGNGITFQFNHPHRSLVIRFLGHQHLIHKVAVLTAELLALVKWQACIALAGRLPLQ